MTKSTDSSTKIIRKLFVTKKTKCQQKDIKKCNICSNLTKQKNAMISLTDAMNEVLAQQNSQLK
jgi:hypothetical protein